LRLVVKIVLLLLLVACSGTATVKKYADLQFYHDQNRGNVKFVCWRNQDTGWECSRYIKKICKENIDYK